MKKTRFLISSLLAAGILPVSNAKGQFIDGAGSGSSDSNDDDAIIARFAQDHLFHLAQHRSHSSHASHASHRSGTSGVPRAPVYTPPPPALPRATPTPSPTRNSRSTPPSSILPSSPAVAPSRATIEEIVRKVQTGLIALGYYSGPADGIVGPKTRAALIRFQTDYRLRVTGTISQEVLDAFRVAAN